MRLIVFIFTFLVGMVAAMWILYAADLTASATIYMSASLGQLYTFSPGDVVTIDANGVRKTGVVTSGVVQINVNLPLGKAAAIAAAGSYYSGCTYGASSTCMLATSGTYTVQPGQYMVMIVDNPVYYRPVGVVTLIAAALLAAFVALFVHNPRR